MSNWLPEEREALEDLARRMRFDEIVEQMTELAQVNSWPVRTRKSIAARLRRSGIAVGYGNAITAKIPAAKWLADETAYLEKIVGDVPFPLLCKRMAKRAAEHGWPVRTPKAIAVRLYKLGHQCSGRNGEWVTTGVVAEILNCKNSRVNKWIHQHGVKRILEPLRVGNVWYVKRSAWRRLAHEMPHILGGYSVDQLYALLEDRELAEQVASEHPLRSSDYRVRCIETGRVWPSQTAAASELHVSHATISNAIVQGRSVPVLGLTFELLRRK
jgi:hypothetical protein